MSSFLQLQAGALSMWFCPQQVFLRHVVWYDASGTPRTIVQGVFPAVRDRDWQTMSFRVLDLAVEQGSDHFHILYRGECDSFPFRWRGDLIGRSDGQIAYRFNGEATETLLKNRIGLCVLHPIDCCAGTACRVFHPDGSQTEGQFPKWISPHQPFKNLRAIRHRIGDEAELEIEFRGEVFEMEDQRNWTDASFKTYSTPLELPFPVQMESGTTVEHEIVIRLTSSPGSAASNYVTAPQTPEVSVTIDRSMRRKRPAIGLSMATCDEPIGRNAIAYLASLPIDHLRFDLDLAATNWMDRLAEAIELADRIGCHLEPALFADRDSLSKVATCVDRLCDWPRTARILVFGSQEKTTPQWLVDWMSERLGESNRFPLVVGTNAYFAELNRQRPTVPPRAMVCYSINPQVHAFDELSLCETFQGQRETVVSASHFFQRPLVISPITLRPRFNPNATSRPDGASKSPPETDSRQTSHFTAAWTLGSLAQLATHQAVESLTWYETHGPRGIMSTQGERYPLAHVLESALRSESCVAGDISDPLRIASLGLLSADGRTTILLGNFTDRALNVRVVVDGRPEHRVTLATDRIEVLELSS
jgi:hypothetical protein